MACGMNSDKDHIRGLLMDTVVLLCKNGITFKRNIRVQGLLGITIDDDDIFLVQINENVENESGIALSDTVNPVKHASCIVQAPHTNNPPTSKYANLKQQKGIDVTTKVNAISSGESVVQIEPSSTERLKCRRDEASDLKISNVRSSQRICDDINSEASPQVVQKLSVKLKHTSNTDDSCCDKVSSVTRPDETGVGAKPRVFSYTLVERPPSTVKVEPEDDDDVVEIVEQSDMTGAEMGDGYGGVDRDGYEGVDGYNGGEREGYEEVDREEGEFMESYEDEWKEEASHAQCIDWISDHDQSAYQQMSHIPILSGPDHLREENSSQDSASSVRYSDHAPSSARDRNADAETYKSRKKGVHVCTYPGCGRSFTLKYNLLRHETQEHGRTPTKILRYSRTFVPLV